MEETVETEESQNIPQGEKESPESRGAPVSVLDIDFLLFALPFALLIDVLDFALSFGTIVTLIVGGPLIAWMAWRTGSSSIGRKEIQQRQAARQAARAGAKRALRRGVLIFIVELIPIVNLIPFWTIAILLTLKPASSPKNTASEETEQRQVKRQTARAATAA